MGQKPGTARPTAKSLVKDTRRRMQKHHSTAKNIHIILDRLITAACRRGKADALLHSPDQSSEYTSDLLTFTSSQPEVDLLELK